MVKLSPPARLLLRALVTSPGEVPDRNAQERAQQHSMELKISRIRHNRKCPRTAFIPTQGTPESSIAESAQCS